MSSEEECHDVISSSGNKVMSSEEEDCHEVISSRGNEVMSSEEDCRKVISSRDKKAMSTEEACHEVISSSGNKVMSSEEDCNEDISSSGNKVMSSEEEDCREVISSRGKKPMSSEEECHEVISSSGNKVMSSEEDDCHEVISSRGKKPMSSEEECHEVISSSGNKFMSSEEEDCHEVISSNVVKAIPRVTNNYITGDNATVIGDITATNVKIHGSTTSVANIICPVTTEQPSNPVFDNIVISTERRISHYDFSKHVSTRAERTAYRKLQENGRIFIRGKSGSGKSRLALNVLGKVAEETNRKPVELSSWHQWDMIPKSPTSNKLPRTVSEGRPDDKFLYVVMIDDIFGSNSLVQSYVHDWIKIFDKMWPDVESGNVLLLLTSRPEISELCKYEVTKYHLMRSMTYIDLDVGDYSLHSSEKWEMLAKICTNCFSFDEMNKIESMDTSLGFPQCCHFYAGSQKAKKMGVEFFQNPYHYVLEEVTRLRECDGIAYLVLLIVLMKDGCLKFEYFSHKITDEFISFIEKLRQCCRLTVSPTLGYIRDKANSLCGIYLTKTEEEYQFQHQSVFDSVFLSLSRDYPDICIAMCPPRMLVDFVRTRPVGQNEEAVCLTRNSHETLLQQIEKFLLSEKHYETSTILDHPCLQDEDFVWFMVKRWMDKCQLDKMVMRKHEPIPVLVQDNFAEDLSADFGYESSAGCEIVLFSYTTLLADIILKHQQTLLNYVLSNVNLTDAQTFQNFSDLLPCAIYIEDNTLIQSLLDRGLKPNEDCLRALFQAVHIDRDLIEKLFVSVKDTLNRMKDLELMLGCAVMTGNTNLVKLITKNCGHNEKCKEMFRKCLKLFVTYLAPYHEPNVVFDTKVIYDMVTFLLETDCDVDIDELVWIAASHSCATTLRCLLQNSRVDLNKTYEHHFVTVPIDYDYTLMVSYPKQLTKAIHQAVAYGNVDCVAEITEYHNRFRIPASTDVNETSITEVIYGRLQTTESPFVNEATESVRAVKENLYPLHLAAMNGKTETMLYLLNSGVDVDIQNNQGKTPLHIALSHGQPKAVNVLLQNQASMFVKDYEGHTAISYVYGLNSWTTYIRQIDTVKLLVHIGCDITNVDFMGRTILHRAVTFRDEETVKFLSINMYKKFDLNQKDYNGNAVLHTASEWSQVEIIHFLCKHGATVESLNGQGKTVLHIAAKSFYESLEKVSYFLDVEMMNVNATDEDGKTVLFDAIKSINVGVVDLLLGRGVNVNHIDNKGRTLLFHINPRNIEFVDLLVDQGVNVNHKDKKGKTALFIAAKSGYFKIFTKLVDKGSVLNHHDDRGRTVLHETVKRLMCTNTLKSILDGGINPNEQDHDGNTALHVLCRMKNRIDYKSLFSNTVDLFVVKKANLDLKNVEGKTPLDIAIEEKREVFVEVLTEKGAQRAVRYM